MLQMYIVSRYNLAEASRCIAVNYRGDEYTWLFFIIATLDAYSELCRPGSHICLQLVDLWKSNLGYFD